MPKKSTRLIILGSIYLVLGALALIFTPASTLFAVMALAAILFVAGISQIVYGIQGRKHGQMWSHLTLGVLGVVCAILIARNPIANTLGLTLIVGFLLLASGIAKVIGSFVEGSTGWGYYAFNGIVSVLLASIILYTFPASAFWTIGTFVGVDLVFGGLSIIGLGFALRNEHKELLRDMKTVKSMQPISYDEIEYHYFQAQGKDWESLRESDKTSTPLH